MKKRGRVKMECSMKKSFKTPTDYAYQSVLYTIISLIIFSFLILNLHRTDYGFIFEAFGALILMIATGVAALVAAGLTLYHATDWQGRRLAYICIVALIAAATVYIVSISGLGER